MNDDPLFRTTEDALRFAFHYRHQQSDRPMLGGLAGKNRSSARGLFGLDGAAQAGMIRRVLTQMPNLERAILIARYAPHTFPCACGRPCCSGQSINFEWREAVRTVASYACDYVPGGAGKFRLRHEVVARYFGVRALMSEIAERCGVNPDTVTAHNNAVVTWLRGPKVLKPGHEPGLEAQAKTKADMLLSDAGMVE